MILTAPATPLSFALVEADVNANNPLIGWHNVVTIANITADTEATDYPATNLANPATNLGWRADDTTEQYLTVGLSSFTEEVDYVGIARHNFGTAGITPSVEGLAEAGSPEDWVELVADSSLADDAPLVFRFTPQILQQIRVKLPTGTVAARAAVLYVGKLMVLPRRVYVGHTPFTDGLQTKVVTGRSESGRFLGRIVIAEMAQTSVALSKLSPTWFRAYMRPFIRSAIEYPFFFAWRPQSYPGEVGYAWLTSDPQPSNEMSNGMMQVQLQMAGEVT